jgi:hypothetical protein
MNYLSIDTNAKTIKGQTKGYLTGILYLAPADLSGKNLCPHASKGCKAACLFTAGRGAMNPIREARLRKTFAFLNDRKAFVEDLKKDIAALQKKAIKKGMIPCVRLNGTSDLPWHSMGIFQSFSDIQFYDYTPNKDRMVEFLKGKLPSNYHLTFSRKEDNQESVQYILNAGGNVAVVFAGEFPQTYLGKPVVNGDETDLRFLDGENVVVGLKAKGKAKKDESGFVVMVEEGIEK